MGSKPTFGSLFAGIGGVCKGFVNAGFKPLWANEWDKRACETYRYNFKHKLVEGDIHDLADPVKQLGEVDVVTSGFPCQAFSVAGYRLGFKDPRGNLFFETARIIDSIKPKAFLLENVKNLLGHDNGRTFKIIEEVLTKDLKYSFIPFVLNAKDFGVPQTRERIYVVGFKGESEVPFFGEDSLFNIADKNGSFCTSKFKIPSKIPLSKKIEDVLSSGKQEKRFYYGKDSNTSPSLMRK
jgi:DNA (cytosine-5)-methyltransferase 1